MLDPTYGVRGCLNCELSLRFADAFRINPKGPSTQYLGTWVLGNSDYSAGFLGKYSEYPIFRYLGIG